MDKNFLHEMLSTYSPSGFEFALQKKIMNHMFDIADVIQTHHSGNAFYVLNPEASLSVMLVGHIDEIGLVITNILSNGLAKVTAAGSFKAGMYIGHRVYAITQDGRIVPGTGAVYQNAFDKKPSTEDLYIDFGVDSKEACLKLVQPGDYVHFSDTYQYLSNERLCSRALDDKIGAFTCLEALKRAKEYQCKNKVITLTSVGEETTMRGGTFATSVIKPSIAIVVDVTFVTDSVENVGCGDVSLGKGPVLCHGSIINKRLNQLLECTAKDLGIAVQYEIAVGRTGTDADKIYFSLDGIPTALVSIPLKYMHSPSEICDMKDVEQCIELLARFIIRLEDTKALNLLDEG